MGLEVGTYVSDLVATNPLSTDLVSVGDDHLRLTKSVLRNTLPNGDRAQYFKRAVGKTANYVVLSTDMEKVFAGDATAGAISLTLPTLAAGNDGWTCEIAKVDSSTNAVTIVGTINGTVNLVLATQYASAILVWNGTDWNCYTFSDISSLVALTAPAVDDYVRILDTSARLSKKIALSDLLTVINVLTADASPDSAADYLVTYDASAAAVKKVLLANFPAQLSRGFIDGCILSNGADAVNDIKVAAGVCRDSTNAVDISVPAFATGKQLDANWAAGDAAGMRNSAAGIANTTYHLWAARTAASATADIYAHTSTVAATVLTALQAETGGASYAYLRHIGSVVRASATILAFHQTGDEFWLDTPVLDISATNPGTAAVTRVLASVPTGIIMPAIIQASLNMASSNAGNGYISALTGVDIAASLNNCTVASGTGNAAGATSQARVIVDTSAQVRSRLSISGASDVIKILTLGWVHPRGKNS